MLLFPKMNGIRIRYTDDGLVSVGLSVADVSMKCDDFLARITDHKE